MIEPGHLLQYIIRPVLKDLNLWSENAERLLLGTACVESHCGQYLVQLGGPAVGIFQMEPATHEDIHANFLPRRPRIQPLVWALASDYTPQEMIGNLYYATAMARVYYLRDPNPIPNNMPAQAEYWKKVYNTHLGRGTVDGYIRAWHRFIGNAWV